MMHFEAALRLAMGSKKLRFKTKLVLKDYYLVNPNKKSLVGRLFKVKVPSVKSSIVLEEDSFDSSTLPTVLRWLMAGYIVTSSKPTEKGLEYLAPFFDASTGKLVVACVQCKFVQEKVDWQQASRMTFLPSIQQEPGRE